MRVAVIDVGSNSVRLLVASVKRSGEVRELERERVYMRLGDDAYRLGHIGAAKLRELGAVGTSYAAAARGARAQRIETIVTAPGRQSANADEIVRTLERATRAPVVVLSAEDEGRLAWEGAVASMEDPRGLVGVVDLGGGSCEVAVGEAGNASPWVSSRDVGALRVTRAFLPADRPSTKEVADAREEIRQLLADLDPPQPDTALAVGGTARAVGRIVGRPFGVRRLDELVERIVRKGPEAVTAGLDVTPERTETLLGGTLVLSEVARELDAKLEVGRGGLREGAALGLARAHAAAA